jgi:hypothetical protein
MTELQLKEFDFLEHKVVAVCYQNRWYFSPRHFCETWGMSWPAQYRKLKMDMEKFNCCFRATVGLDGKTREMLLIPASHVDTWVLNIEIGRVKEEARPILRLYRDQLTAWLHARNFLTPEEEAAVVNLAIERGANIARLSLEEKRDKVLALPEEFSAYKQDTVTLITDVMIGRQSPQILGEPCILTPQSFYKDYVIEGCCDDKIIIKYPDFATPEDIAQYAEQQRIKRTLLHSLPMSFTLMAKITKAHKMFRTSISDLVSYYNMSAEDIRYAINWIEFWLVGYFGDKRVILEESTRQTQADIYQRYMNNIMWHQKRDAYFSVYNCCIDCPPNVGWEVVSKKFNAHHLHYQTLGKEHPDDLVPLCRPCHAKREEKREWN